MENITDSAETIKYYKDFGAKRYEPMRLYNEISIDEIKNDRVYLKAFYKNGKLMIVEKYLDGNLFFRFSYTYDGDKVVDTKIFYGEQQQETEAILMESDWEKHQNSLRNEILKQKENKVLKESFLQEMYIRNVVCASNDSLFATIPFNLHSFDCGAPDCYSTDVSFSFKLGDTLKFPKILSFKEHEYGCVPEETKLSGTFQLMEQTEKHVIYYSTEHKRALILFSKKVLGTTAFYFAKIEQDKINSKSVYEILEKDADFLDSFGIYRSWVLTTNEYENFLQ